MERATHVCILFLLPIALLMVGSVQGYDLYVGGRDGWVTKPSESYGSWSNRLRFSVNDSLVFLYDKAVDSVLEVTSADYSSCRAASPITRLATGRDSFKLIRSGPFYFISGNASHCQSGQKLVVVVLAVRSPRSSPAPGITPPSPPGSAPPAKAPAPGISTTPSSTPAAAPALTPSHAPGPAGASAISPALTPSPSGAPVLAPSSTGAPSPPGGSGGGSVPSSESAPGSESGPGSASSPPSPPSGSGAHFRSGPSAFPAVVAAAALALFGVPLL